MSVIIYARKELVSAEHKAIESTNQTGRFVLLEGAWPEDKVGRTCRVRPVVGSVLCPPSVAPGRCDPLVQRDAGSGSYLSLDESIDARFGWVDEEAARLANLAADEAGQFTSGGPLTAAWINALPLRYYMVKLARVIAFFTEVCRLTRDDEINLTVAAGRDDDYADLIVSLADLTGAQLNVSRIERPAAPQPEFPPNQFWRRRAAGWLGTVEREVSREGRPRVVLCGNPRLLEPVGRELLRRDCRLWWLYDRFALKTWLRWRPCGVGQLVCDSSLADENRIPQPELPPLVCRSVELTETVRRWIVERMRTHGPRQTRIVERIDEHFERVQPDAVVLDQDATPFARAAVGLSRRRGVRSFVVQHGAPLSRFGFAPPAADKILAWGRSSRETLLRWGVTAERILVVGSPWHEGLSRTLGRSVNHRSRSCCRGSVGNGSEARLFLGDFASLLPRLRFGLLCQWAAKRHAAAEILLLATVPPSDARPDSVELHLTRSTYAEMLRSAFWAVNRVPHATLVVKLHPRSPHDPVVGDLVSRFDRLRVRIVAKGPLEPLIARADCVLSCVSSAGIDATLAGVPVIQLVPERCGSVLPADEWGLFGSASDGAGLEQLLTRALAAGGGLPAKIQDVFHGLDGGSVARIADEVMAIGSSSSRESRIHRQRHNSTSDQLASVR